MPPFANSATRCCEIHGENPDARRKAVKPVTLDPKTTALLTLDFNRQTCNAERRPRCVASIPEVKPLLEAARAVHMPVPFSLGGGGKPADLPKDLAPTADEPVVSPGVDKFRNADLEKFLRQQGVTSVVVVGTAAHGAVLYTASTAAMLGMKVIVPVDGISADTPYIEQYVVWHFANAELIVASSGIGYLLVKGQANISTPIVMSGMIAIGIVGFAIDALLRAAERAIERRRGRG